jgi:hypothetical protein
MEARRDEARRGDSADSKVRSMAMGILLDKTAASRSPRLQRKRVGWSVGTKPDASFKIRFNRMND